MRDALARNDFPGSPDDEPTPIDRGVHEPIRRTVQHMREQIAIMLGEIRRISSRVKWMTVATFAAMVITLVALGGVAWLIERRVACGRTPYLAPPSGLRARLSGTLPSNMSCRS